MSDRIRKLMTEGQTKIDKKPLVRALPVKKNISENKETGKNDFVARDISPVMKENIQIILRSDITPDDLKILQDLGSKRREAIHALEKIGQEGVDAICQIASEDETIKISKIKVISFINKLTSKESFRKIFHKIGVLIHSLRKIKELLEIH